MSRQDLSYQPDQPFDPYRPPESPSQNSPGYVPTLGGPDAAPFTLNGVTGRAWALYRERMGLCIAAYAVGFVVVFGVQMAMSAIGDAVQRSVDNPSGILAVVGLIQIALTVFGLWIGIGQSLVYLKVAERRPSSVGDIFAGGRYLGPMIVATTLLSLLGGGIFLLGALPGIGVMAASGPNSPLGLGVLVLGLLGAFLFLSLFWIYLSQYFFVILDRPALGAMGALRESMRITRGKFWRITVVYIAAGAVNLLGMLALLVGLIVSIPFSFVMLAVMYTALVSEAGVARKQVGPSGLA